MPLSIRQPIAAKMGHASAGLLAHVLTYCFAGVLGCTDRITNFLRPGSLINRLMNLCAVFLYITTLPITCSTRLLLVRHADMGIDWSESNPP